MEGGHLAEVDSEEKDLYLTELLKWSGGSEGAWIGATDASKEGEWRWVIADKIAPSVSLYIPYSQPRYTTYIKILYNQVPKLYIFMLHSDEHQILFAWPTDKSGLVMVRKVAGRS